MLDEEPRFEIKIASLTRQEQKVFAVASRGGTAEAIAQELEITKRTAYNHLCSIYRKLGISSQLDLVKFALAHQLLSLKAVISCSQVGEQLMQQGFICSSVSGVVSAKSSITANQHHTYAEN
jgi:DNA-binding CsgD family transcriptional regulator